MKPTIAIAALILGGVLVGCDNSSTSTPPAMPAGSTSTPAMPASPDTSKMTNSINNAVDKGADAAKTQADKMMGNAPTTMPGMPK